jgi:hypothetical protein
VEEEAEGVPPPNVQFQEVGEPEAELVKEIQFELQNVV